jgi:hypothetical protein
MSMMLTGTSSTFTSNTGSDKDDLFAAIDPEKPSSSCV